MKVENFAEGGICVWLEGDERYQLELTVGALDDDKINDVNDLIAWGLFTLMDSWPDILQNRLVMDPEYPASHLHPEIAVVDENKFYGNSG